MNVYKDSHENILEEAIGKNECPEMSLIMTQIRDAYLELANACSANYGESDKEQLNLQVNFESSKVNVMKKGDRLNVHSHFGDDAFACFYFNDVADSEGGKLALYDPRWNRNYWFAGSKLEKIRPERAMLVIAPGFLWHEVVIIQPSLNRGRKNAFREGQFESLLYT